MTPAQNPIPSPTTRQPRAAARALDRLRRLPLALEALLWLTGAWLILDVLPGRQYRRFLPRATSPDDDGPLPPHDGPAFQQRDVVRIGWAVQRASKAVPFRSVCFHRGLAARRMLERRGIPCILHYGVGKNDTGGLGAHVWVSCREHDVVGGPDKAPFQEIARFPSRSRTGAEPSRKPQP